MDSAVDAASAEKACVGGVDDAVGGYMGNVTANDGTVGVDLYREREDVRKVWCMVVKTDGYVGEGKKRERGGGGGGGRKGRVTSQKEAYMQLSWVSLG